MSAADSSCFGLRIMPSSLPFCRWLPILDLSFALSVSGKRRFPPHLVRPLSLPLFAFIVTHTNIHAHKCPLSPSHVMMTRQTSLSPALASSLPLSLSLCPRTLLRPSERAIDHASVEMCTRDSPLIPCSETGDDDTRHHDLLSHSDSRNLLSSPDCTVIFVLFCRSRQITKSLSCSRRVALLQEKAGAFPSLRRRRQASARTA